MIKTVPGHASGKLLTTANTEEESKRLDFEKWLPYAATELKISTNPKDYIFTVVPIMYTDLPNRNGVSFPLKELLRWRPEYGCQAYKTWVGMPMHQEHQADDHTKALGVIVDVALRPLKDHGNDKNRKIGRAHV